MFSLELNGYNKKEVDNYLSKLKADYEQILMEERLKLLEAEKKNFDMKKRYADVENREKKIVKALDSFQKMQSEGNRNIDLLRIEQIKLIYLRLQDFLIDLNAKHPGILVNNSYKRLMADIENVISSSSDSSTLKTGTENDSMRILLSKMKEKKNLLNLQVI